MALKHFFNLVNIEPGEGRLVSLMFWHYFLMGVVFHFTQTAAFAIFLANFNAQNLPYVYIINAITITLLISGYLKLGQWFSFTAMLAVNLGFLLTLTVFFGLGVPTGAGWLLFLLPTLFETTVQLGNLEFWSLAGRLFDLRQSKRLFGLVGAGNWVAVIIGGFLTPWLVELVGVTNLLWISVMALAATMGLLIYTSRLYASYLAAPTGPTSTAPSPQTSTNTLKSRYARLIFALVSLGWIGFFFIDNIFFIRAGERFTDEAQLASFLGLFFAAMGIVALFASVALTGPFIGRFGVRPAIRLLPTILLGGTLLMILSGWLPPLFMLLFWITATVKLLDMALGFTFDRVALNILYQPLPASPRLLVKTTAEGIFLPAAIGVSGAALLFFGQWLNFNANQLTYILLLIVTGWTVVAVLIGRQYPVMLLKALTQRRLSGAELPLEDESSQAVLRQALQNPHPGVALYALNQLVQADPSALSANLPLLLAHPAPAMRQETLRQIEQLNLTSALPMVKRHLQFETSAEGRAAALHTMAHLGQAEVVEEIYAFLDDPEPALKSAAIVGLLQHGSLEVTMMAERKLLQLATSPNPTERGAAAHIIGQVKARNLAPLLDNLLQDEETEVRRAALAAAGQAGYKHLWLQVINGLSERKTRRMAMAALVTGGAETLEAISTALSANNLPRDSQLRLLYGCGRIGGPQASQLLLHHLSTPDDGRRTEVVTALYRCGYQASPTEQPAIQHRLEEEIALAGWLLNGLVDLDKSALDQPQNQAAPAWLLLQQALHHRFQQTQHRLLLLLSFLTRSDSVLRARDNLNSPLSEKRAYALEMIELSVPLALKPGLLPLFEALSPAERLARLGATAPQLRLSPQDWLLELINGPHPWTSACALYAAAKLGQASPPLLEAVKACLKRTDPVVVEMAEYALNHLEPQT
jgi:HEAT repeat protein